MNTSRIKIIRSKRKTIALVISPDATLTVKAPIRVSLEYIESLILKKKSWIQRKQQEILKNGGPVKNKEFKEDEDFLFLGNIYSLRIQDCKEIFLTDHLYFPRKYLKKPKEKIISWYKKEALKILSKRMDYYSQITGWKFKSISITSAKQRWGSCSHNGSIHFTWRLVMAPIEVVDYLVVHELAHIVEKNHSSRFWDKVKNILPDYKVQEKWLKDNGRRLVI